MDTVDVLTELCSIPGPSGFEKTVAERFRGLIEPYMDETWIDVLGNVIGVKRCGMEGAPKLLFDAHIDEIGLIITGYEEGFLRFARLGGLDARVMPASGVEVLTDPIRYGVIRVLPPHVLKTEEMDKVIKLEDMYIDIGLTQEEAEKAVPLGTPAVLVSSFRHLGESCVCSKALDDRAGLAAILRSLKLLEGAELDVDLYVMASVQEEVGTRGAAPGVFAIAPDYCAVVDVSHAKTPDAKPAEANTELGAGVIINRGPNMNTALVETVIKLARESKIKYQIDVEPRGDSGTNARAIQVSRTGVATAVFCIPMRYMHSANEVLSLEDLEETARLLCETAKHL
jgi:endoglucanase